MLNLITVSMFFAVGAMVYLLAEQIRKTQTDPIRRRLQQSDWRPLEVGGQWAGPPAPWTGLAAQIPRAQSQSELEFELRQAGYFNPSDATTFLAIRNGLIISAMLGTFALIAVIGPQRNDLAVRAIVGGLALCAMCWGIPRTLLRLQGKRRIHQINRSLPYALDLLTMCLSGGLSLRKSLAHVSRELVRTDPDLAAEMAIIQQQGEMTTLETAFQQFADRIQTADVAALSALIIQNQRLGTSIATSISDFAEGMRTKGRQLADERAAKLGIKMLFPMTLMLLPALILLLWGPAVLELIDFFANMDVDLFDEGVIPQSPDVSFLSDPQGG